MEHALLPLSWGAIVVSMPRGLLVNSEKRRGNARRGDFQTFSVVEDGAHKYSVHSGKYLSTASGAAGAATYVAIFAAKGLVLATMYRGTAGGAGHYVH